MHTSRRIALCLAACLGLATAHAQQQFRVVERESIRAEELGLVHAGSHKLHLSLVQMEGSGWTRERALAAVREAASILAQCDLAVARIEWIRLAVPLQYLDFFTPLSREVARAHPVERPAIYLVRETRNRPAFDAEAIGRGNSRTRPELADTVWMIAAARDPGVALAHELAHVLMNSGEHSDDPRNLMQDQTDAAHTLLEDTQCLRMRQNAQAHGLLGR